MKAFARQVMDAAQLQHVDWADVRVAHRTTETITVRNKIPETVRADESLGFGVRVCKNGAWGFAASSEITTKALTKTVRRAVRIAQASAMVGVRKRRLARHPPVVDHYATSARIDPFGVPLADKLALLTDATELMLKEKNVKLALAFYSAFKERRIYADLRGSLIEQDIIETGGGIQACAIAKGEMQVRSYPNSFRGKKRWQIFTSRIALSRSCCQSILGICIDACRRIRWD